MTNVPLHFRQTLDRLKQKMPISQEREIELLEAMRILGIEDFSPEMSAELLRFYVINQPIELALKKVNDAVGGLSVIMREKDENNQEAGRSVEDFSATIKDLPGAVQKAAYEGSKKAYEEVVDAKFEGLMRTLNANYVSKEDMMSAMNREIGGIGRQIKDSMDNIIVAINRATQALKESAKANIKAKTPMSLWVGSLTAAIFVGIIIGKFFA